MSRLLSTTKSLVQCYHHNYLESIKLPNKIQDNINNKDYKLISHTTNEVSLSRLQGVTTWYMHQLVIQITKWKSSVLDKIPLSCKMSAVLDSNSNALVKSSIAWYRKQCAGSHLRIFFVQENHIQSELTQVRHHMKHQNFQSFNISNSRHWNVW